MGILTLPWGLTKPPLGWQPNWNAVDELQLNEAWLLNEDAGQTFFELLRGNIATYTRSNADTGFTVNDRGSPAFNMNADGGGATCDSKLTSGLGTNSVSVYARFMINTTNGFLFTCAPNGTSGDELFSCRSISANVSPTLYYNTSFFAFTADSNGLLVGAESAATPAGGVWYDLCGTFQNTGSGTYGGTWQTYLAGIPNGTSNSLNVAGTFAGTFSNSLESIGRCSNLVNTETNAKFLDFILVGLRCWTPDEVLRLYTDPFWWMQRRGRVAYSLPAAAFVGDDDGVLFPVSTYW